MDKNKNITIMEIKVKYRAMGLRGNSLRFTHTHTCPDFEEQTSTFILSEQTHTFVSSVENQVIEWLDTLDKMFLIYEKDIQCIIDYEIVKTKAKKAKKEESIVVLQEYVRDFNISDEMKIDFFLAYDRIKDSIKSLSTVDKVTTILLTLGFAYDAKSAAFQQMIDLYDSHKSTKQLLEIK